MNERNLVIALGLTLSLVAAQRTLAAQDPALGYDPFHQFGYERPVAATKESGDTTALYKRVVPQMPRYEVDYVYGSDARQFARSGPTQTVLQIRDALGEQAGA